MCTQVFCRQAWPQLNSRNYCLPSVTHARCHKHFIDWRWKCENLNTAFKLSGKWIVVGNSPLCQSCHTVPAERSDFSSAEEWRDVMWFDYLNNSGSVMALELSLWRESGKWPNWTPSGPSILFVASVACFFFPASSSRRIIRCLFIVNERSVSVAWHSHTKRPEII